jgi:O-antigen ligase
MGWLWGLWLATFPMAEFFLRDRHNDHGSYSLDDFRTAPAAVSAALLIILVLGCVPAGLSWLQLGVNFRRAKPLISILLPILTMVTISLIGINSMSPLANAVGLAYVFMLAAIFNSLRANESLMRGLLEALAVGHMFILVVMINDANYSWGRLFGRSSPNFWGLIGCTLLLIQFALSRWWLQVAAAIVAASTMVLCQSRGSEISSFSGLILIGVLWTMYKPAERIKYAITAALVGAMGLMLGYKVILDKILLSTNSHRAVESGSGRAEAWKEAIQIIIHNPWAGVGYRQSDAMIRSASSAHNAYLATGAELGLLGLLFYLVLLFGGLTRAIRLNLLRPTPTRLAVAGFLISYVIIGFMERKGLNIGNTHALLMIFCACWAWTQPLKPMRPVS